MPEQLRVIIDGQTVDLAPTETSPVQISYTIEDDGDFQSKGSGAAYDLTAPATLQNDQLFNTFRNPAIIDNSPDSRYRKNRAARVLLGSTPLLTGQALLQSGTSGGRADSYRFTILGDNGDWLTQMQDLTLYDCLPTNQHLLALYQSGNRYGIEDTWFFDGYDESKSWVYAPVRYAQAFADLDLNMRIVQMRPSLFIYWMIARAFKRYGYGISSSFMDSAFFRRIVMPWTFGNFLGINTKLSELLKFRVAGDTSQPTNQIQSAYYFYDNSNVKRSGNFIVKPEPGGNVPTNVKNFSLNNTTATGAYDNNGNYSRDDANGIWKWTYKTANGTNFGKITAYFGVAVQGEVIARANSSTTLYCDVFKNGTLVQTQVIFDAQATGPTSDVRDGGLFSSSTPPKQFNFSVSGLQVGDTVAIQFRVVWSKSTFGTCSFFMYGAYSDGLGWALTTFELFRIEIEPGGIVDWSNFNQFKDYKFLDFLRGILDTFDLVPKTDALTKTVTIEPSYGGQVGNTTFAGYFLPQRRDWSAKLDLSQPNEVASYTDPVRDYLFQMQEDNQDGGAQILQKRYNRQVGVAKFRFSSRFKEGKQTFENRFFSPVMHLRKTEWTNLPGGYGRTPQIIAIVPEKISDTSSSEQEPAFSPKLAYYKGYIQSTQASGVGVFRMNGYTYSGYPYMFAVNYQPGGENDIALTYNDQLINGQVVAGLLRRFFLQRLAIQDNGVIYRPWLLLNARDVTDPLQRTRISIRGTQYVLTNIDRWDPLRPVSCQASMWKFVPVELKHRLQVYPSDGSVRGQLNPVPSVDLGYQPDIIFNSDLPKIGT